MKLLSVIIISLITLIQTADAQQGSLYTRLGLGDVQNSYSARRWVWVSSEHLLQMRILLAH